MNDTEVVHRSESSVPQPFSCVLRTGMRSASTSVGSSTNSSHLSKSRRVSATHLAAGARTRQQQVAGEDVAAAARLWASQGGQSSGPEARDADLLCSTGSTGSILGWPTAADASIEEARGSL